MLVPVALPRDGFKSLTHDVAAWSQAEIRGKLTSSLSTRTRVKAEMSRRNEETVLCIMCQGTRMVGEGLRNDRITGKKGKVFSR